MSVRPLFFYAALATLTACGGASKAYEPASTAYGPMDATAAMPPPAPMAPPMEMADAELASAGGSVSGYADMYRKEEADGQLAQAPGRAPPPPPPPPKSTTPSGTQGQGDSKDAQSAVAKQGPMLIYTAEVTMASYEVAAQIDKIEALSRELGGFLARRDDTTIQVRVPVERFDEAMKRVLGMGDVLRRNVSVQDVTEEYRDLDIQMKNARAMRDRLAELLQKATKVEDSLLIERELGRVTRELERLEGRLKYLRDRAAFSTITVVFQPRAVERVGSEDFRLPVPWLYDLSLSRLMNL